MYIKVQRGCSKNNELIRVPFQSPHKHNESTCYKKIAQLNYQYAGDVIRHKCSSIRHIKLDKQIKPYAES